MCIYACIYMYIYIILPLKIKLLYAQGIQYKVRVKRVKAEGMKEKIKESQKIFLWQKYGLFFFWRPLRFFLWPLQGSWHQGWELRYFCVAYGATQHGDGSKFTGRKRDHVLILPHPKHMGRQSPSFTFKCNQSHLFFLISKTTLFFYKENQSIKWKKKHCWKCKPRPD